MAISVETAYQWIVMNDLAPKDTQAASELAISLVEALRASESTLTQKDNRNIHDHFKEYDTEEVRAMLAAQRSGLVSIFLNVLGDFNLSSGIRNANWFNTSSVYIAGRRKWDRRGAVGTHHYTEVNHAPDIFALIDDLRKDGYTVVAAEINEDAVPLTTYEWKEKTAVIYGEEGAGVPQDVIDYIDAVIYIPGRGSVRSLNVATTAGIFMYDYSAKTGLINF